MSIIPEIFLEKLKQNTEFQKFAIEIELNSSKVIANQPIFFPEYTDHGIGHFSDTLKMALHLISVDPYKVNPEQIAVMDHLDSLNILTLVASILTHDIGMHIHFEGFKQLINGEYDDVRNEFFDEFTWAKEWENFAIEAKRFSGRQRIKIWGDEQVIIQEVDFLKKSVDSDIQKKLIGEFIRRHHGRLAHEISIKGFPVKENEKIELINGLLFDYRDIIGLIARSHSMTVRDAMTYLEKKFPADSKSPYQIEVPFLMCVLRIADYFQFDNSRTNSFIVKLKSFESPFSLDEHKTHLATQYFKTDEKDPETLFVHLTPSNGLMYNKLIDLFDNIQHELDNTFAVLGEMYGRYKDFLRLRYRRINTNLKNQEVIKGLTYVAGVHGFEADTDLFKLLVGPLYGYDPSYGVRELLQNSIDACLELKFKQPNSSLTIKVDLKKENDTYFFSIKDNGKGMSIGEIKNYFLKAGSSFRNSTEWKIDYQDENNTPNVRRTGKFGIGVLASFLIGDSINVKTRRFNEKIGYSFSANLTDEFIEVIKDDFCEIGTTIVIKITEDTFNKLKANADKEESTLTKWYLLDYPPIVYSINDVQLEVNKSNIALKDNKQYLDDAVTIDYENFDDIIWSFDIDKRLAINGITIPGNYSFPSPYDYYERNKKKTIYDELDKFPFLSILDRNNLIDLELSRNSIRGHVPFIKELVQSCKLDFLYKLLFFYPTIDGDILDFSAPNFNRWDYEYEFTLNAPQFNSNKILASKEGYFLNNQFYNPIKKGLKHFKLYISPDHPKKFKILDKSTYSFIISSGIQHERSILRGDYGSYLGIVKPNIYLNNHNSTSIAKYLRDDMKKIEETNEFIFYQKGDWKNSADKRELQYLYEANKALAVQITNKNLHNDEYLAKLLKEHFGEPKLIPTDFDAKLKYIKTLSIELQKHLYEKRNIPM